MPSRTVLSTSCTRLIALAVGIFKPVQARIGPNSQFRLVLADDPGRCYSGYRRERPRLRWYQRRCNGRGYGSHHARPHIEAPNLGSTRFKNAQFIMRAHLTAEVFL